MTGAQDTSLAIRTLHSGPRLTISDYTCRAPRGGPAAEDHPGGHNIVLLRRGVFRKHLGRRTLTADTNQTVFFTHGASYRISHPAGDGNRGTIFSPAPEVLLDIVSGLNPAYRDEPEHPFPAAIAPCEPVLFWKHRRFVRQLEAERPERLDRIWVEETAMLMMADALGAAYAHQGAPSPRRRLGTIADHRERTEAAKAYLASRIGEPLSLEEVARAVHTSPFHLSRIFREHAGVTVHRYRSRLRLRTALERLTEGANDLSRLAMELGFSSHAHFSDAFRREFGRTPSSVRADLTRRTSHQMSKILEA